MPVNYNFRFADCPETDPTCLQDRRIVDDELRTCCGEQPDPERWSSEFEAIVFVLGMELGATTHKSHFTEQEVRDATAKIAADRRAEAAVWRERGDVVKAAAYEEYAVNYEANVEVWVEFMVKRYVFNIWHGN
jgi:hypothetical protein